MKTQHIALAVTIALLGAVYAFAQTGASVADRGFPGRYQLQAGSMMVDTAGTMRPTVFKLDTLTGEVEFLVPQLMPGTQSTVVQSWAVTISNEAYAKLISGGK